MKGIKHTQETFLQRCREVHGDRYDYSKVEYINSKNRINIVCKEHGDFAQFPVPHSSGHGCPKCAGLIIANKLTKSWEQMKESFINTHGERYDYSKVEYVNNNTKVTIICKEHGEFEQIPRTHISGTGCPKCGMGICIQKRAKTKEEIINVFRQTHGSRYIYDKIENNGIRNLVTITCRIHGDFEKSIASHKVYAHCPECMKVRRRRMNKIHVIEIIERFKATHGDFYDYSKVRYKNQDSRVTIICPEHGEFKQKPSNHLSGKGCAKCSNSKLATRVRVLLEQLKIDYEMEKSFDGCRAKLPLRFDFYLPEHNTLVECQGEQHYHPVEVFAGKKGFKDQQRRDQIKRDFCEKEGIPLVEIPYWFIDEEIEQVILDNLK